jgi:integrase
MQIAGAGPDVRYSLQQSQLTGSTAPRHAVLVFADQATGQPPYKPGILKRFRKALRVPQLDESHRFHGLRHTLGTRMAAASVPMRTLGMAGPPGPRIGRRLHPLGTLP